VGFYSCCKRKRRGKNTNGLTFLKGKMALGKDPFSATKTENIQGLPVFKNLF